MKNFIRWGCLAACLLTAGQAAAVSNTTKGAVGGALGGAVVAGPVGLVVGGVGGAVIGRHWRGHGSHASGRRRHSSLTHRRQH